MKTSSILLLVSLAISHVHGKRIGSSSVIDAESSTPLVAANQNNAKETSRDLSSKPTLTYKGQNGLPASAYPLGVCEGSCRGDYDCSSNLQCFKASSSTTSVRGCDGTPKAGLGYCVSKSSPPSPTPPKPTPPSPSSLKRFRLRLYWKQGYTWGNITSEQRLCMQCASKPCKLHEILKLQTCSSSSAVFRFLSPTPVANTVQIRIVGTSYCLEKTGHRAVQSENCRSGNYTKQFWTGGNDLSKSKFEIKPLGYSNTLCLTADGKPNDPIYVQNCKNKQKINVTNWSPF